MPYNDEGFIMCIVFICILYSIQASSFKLGPEYQHENVG